MGICVISDRQTLRQWKTKHQESGQRHGEAGGAQQLVLAATDFPGKYVYFLIESSSRWGKTIGGRITCTTIIYI